MKNNLLKSIGTLIIVSVLSSYAYGQELQVSLFEDVNRTMQEAYETQADVLSPGKFEEGMEAYKAAQKGYADEGEIAGIKQNIGKADRKFLEAIENTKVSSVMFTQALSARKDAMNAEAQKFSKDLWNDAEEEMKEAAVQLEKGDAGDAKEKAKTATGIYREAELESIKVNYLANAKKLVEKADADKVSKAAPKTLKEAKELINKAERELVENRYDTDEARHLAKQAEYKVLLAMYIANQKKIFNDKDYDVEDYLLMSFEPLEKIGENLDMEMRFDKGVAAPVAQIVGRLDQNEQQIFNLKAANYDSKKQNTNLTALLSEQRKIQSVKDGQMTEEALQAQQRQLVLQQQIDQAALIDEKFDKIQQIFTADEAQVFRQKDEVIIRMIGINFDVNTAIIKEEDYSILTKVQTALTTFDNASIVIEGHTDSQGGDDANMELSKKRADAILSYLSANSKINKARFSTEGFGESKPVANNETALGRTKNRRIDIVIRPTLPGSVTSASNTK